MPRIDIEDFSDKDISRFFIASNIGEAERAESLLTENGLSYAVENEEFIKASLFSTGTMEGVAFYVLSGQRDFCRKLFLANGLVAGLLDIED